MYFWLLAVLQVIMMPEKNWLDDQNSRGYMLQVRCMVMQRKEMGAHIEPVSVLALLPLHLSEPPAS